MRKVIVGIILIILFCITILFELVGILVLFDNFGFIKGLVALILSLLIIRGMKCIIKRKFKILR